MINRKDWSLNQYNYRCQTFSINAEGFYSCGRSPVLHLISFQTASAWGILPCSHCWSLHRHHGHPVESSHHGWGDGIPIFSFPFALVHSHLTTLYRPKDHTSSIQTLSRDTRSSQGTTDSQTHFSSSLTQSLQPAETPTAASFLWRGASNPKEPVPSFHPWSPKLKTN